MAGGGGSEPNLTPFIDLFSVLICFLLMTAAWIQLESVQVQIEKKPEITPEVAAETPPPPEKKPEKKVELKLYLSADKIIAKEDKLEKDFPVNGSDVESTSLDELLKNWRSRFDEKQMIVIHSGDKATYGQLIHLYDLVTHNGWSEVGINPY